MLRAAVKTVEVKRNPQGKGNGEDRGLVWNRDTLIPLDTGRHYP